MCYRERERERERATHVCYYLLASEAPRPQGGPRRRAAVRQDSVGSLCLILTNVVI